MSFSYFHFCVCIILGVFIVSCNEPATVQNDHDPIRELVHQVTDEQLHEFFRDREVCMIKGAIAIDRFDVNSTSFNELEIHHVTFGGTGKSFLLLSSFNDTVRLLGSSDMLDVKEGTYNDNGSYMFNACSVATYDTSNSKELQVIVPVIQNYLYNKYVLRGLKPHYRELNEQVIGAVLAIYRSTYYEDGGVLIGTELYYKDQLMELLQSSAVCTYDNTELDSINKGIRTGEWGSDLDGYYFTSSFGAIAFHVQVNIDDGVVKLDLKKDLIPSKCIYYKVWMCGVGRFTNEFGCK